MAFEEDFAGDDFSRRRRNESHDAKCGDAFSAAAFADDAECLTGVDLPGDVVDGADQAILGAKVCGEVLYEQQITQGLASI